VTDISYPLAVTMIIPTWAGGSSPDFEKSDSKRQL
jgi:hypothetical protein